MERLTPESTGPAVLLSALLIIASGCASTRGPELVVNSHVEYNKAISQVLQEELLLNVVRRRFMEAPQFLNVSSISTNFTTSAGVGAGATALDVGTQNVWNTSVDGSVSFSDSPTVTITPRQGEVIARQLHAPVRVDVVADLSGAGYPVDFALKLLVESVNNLRGPDLRFDEFRSGQAEWREAMELILKLYSDGRLIVDRFKWNDPYNDYPYPAASITPQMWITTLSTGERRWKSYDGGNTFSITTNEMAPAIWLDPEARNTADGQRLMELLNVQSDVKKRAWMLESARVVSGSDFEGQSDDPRSALKLRMRSLYNVLNFYAYAVQVPREDEESGRAIDLRSYRAAVERGEVEDISEILAIRCSDTKPANAFQAVQYRGRWFYIRDEDLVSKAGFNALYDTWQLSIEAPKAGTRPVTTIQVN